MILFIKDRPIRIITQQQAEDSEITAISDQIIDTRLTILKTAHFEGHITLLNITPLGVQKLIQTLESTNIADLQSITLIIKKPELIEKKIKTLFSVVKAAGGIVVKNNKILLMFRRGVWDLPKGKLDSNEKSKEAAIREVEEETGVKAALVDRICVTWHTYWQDDKPILKRTKWYLMTNLDDTNLQPQHEEDIEKLAWLTIKEAKLALTNSYSSIRYVVECYLNEKK